MCLNNIISRKLYAVPNKLNPKALQIWLFFSVEFGIFNPNAKMQYLDQLSKAPCVYLVVPACAPCSAPVLVVTTATATPSAGASSTTPHIQARHRVRERRVRRESHAETEIYLLMCYRILYKKFAFTRAQNVMGYHLILVPRWSLGSPVHSARTNQDTEGCTECPRSLVQFSFDSVVLTS